MSFIVKRLEQVNGRMVEVPWAFKATNQKFTFSLSNLEEDPTTYDSKDLEFTTAEEARVKGLEELNKMEEGIVQIWMHKTDNEGNGESEIVYAYRREKTGPSVTRKHRLI